jgi:VWFA-related protein
MPRAHATTSRILSLALTIGLAAGPAPAGGAALQERPAQETPVFSSQAAAVLVDVVVRDKKGRLVRDLAASDFELYEDGVKQTLESFRVVDRGPGGDPAEEEETADAPAPAASPATAAVPAPVASPAAPAVIAFVFDRLTVNARALAKQAALSYADRSYVPGDMVAVFSIDHALRTIQPFTNDVGAVRTAFEQAAAQANTQFASDRAESRDQEQAANRTADTLAALGGAGGGGGGNPGAVAGVIASQLAAQQMQANILQAFDSMERDQQGFATTHGLMAVVNGLRAIPGRKTVVFFSEGIALPSNVEGQFRQVIASANRANVSVYAIDAAGLRVASGTREAAEELRRNAQNRLRQEEAAGSGRPSREAMSRGMERNEEALRLDPETGLGQLAEETGGFLARGTNDLRLGFGRIAEDMRFHYLLSYSPTNEKMDGIYRTIAVKMRRPDLRVQTRKGYFAVRPEYVLPVRGYEAPALAQLDVSPRPNAFPMGVTALSFPEADRPGLVPVLVSVPGSAVAWRPQQGGGFRADFTVVVRVKDGRGQEADRLSQNYSLTAPADRLEAARKGEVLFYREANLRPGHYTAEAVAFDALARTSSVRMVELDVPAPADGVQLSSLVVVTRAEKLSEAEQKSGKNPLHFGEAILYPNMGEPFHKSTTPALGFYFSVYGGGKAPAVQQATIQVQQGERVVANTTSPLPAPDAQGRIQHAGAIPLKSLAPGSYTMKVSVGQGASAQSRTAAFTVVE